MEHLTEYWRAYRHYAGGDFTQFALISRRGGMREASVIRGTSRYQRSGLFIP